MAIPVLQTDRVEERPLHAWLKQHRPDVIIVVHVHEILSDLMAILNKPGVARVPQQMGVAALSQVLKGTGLSGVEENERLMGEWAVELLVERIVNRDFGIPDHPRIEMVEGQWVDGKSLRQQAG
jgi:LacI family transcriptional regulator